MTPDQTRLVMETWKQVLPIADSAADLFYGRLFALDPTLRPLFSADLSEQKKKLMATIGFAVGSVNRLEDLVPVFQALGKRHAGYGVTEAHYETVGAALLWTLEKGLATAWTPQAAEAWATVYGVLASTMKAAAAES